jgi:signal transduction histidine kinase/DNA-binding response OmpR family regulator
MRPQQTQSLQNAVMIALAIVTLAWLLRINLLGGLGTRVIWLTFYPAVVIASVMQGLWSGTLAAALSCAIVLWLWPALGHGTPIKDGADMLGMAVFFGNCVLISGVAESMRRARRQADAALKQAEAANQAKSIFLANISHELRTPLNAILGFSQLLRKDPALGPEQTARLQTISHSGEHLLHLINNIIDLSRIEAGHITLDPSDTDVHSLVEETLAMVRWKTEAKGIELSVQYAADVPRWVRIDRNKLRQILLNLLGNAAKFTERGQITLRLTAASDPGDGTDVISAPRLCLEVIDSGPGMNAELQAQLFQPFVQGTEQPANETGSGLGLAISRQIVLAMGGQISVTSAPGSGSCFRVELPIEPATANSQLIEVSLAGEQSLTLAPGTPRHRLLIVEDEPVNRQLLREILAPFAFEVREADNGQAALDLIADWRPELVWMDVRMPVMGGIEATRRIRALEPGEANSRRIHIVALTAHALETERQEIRDAGCDEVLQKPYQLHEILGALTRYLGVQFVAAPLSAAPVQITAGELGILSTAQLAELGEAVATLEASACHATINVIAQNGLTELAARLHRMVENFRFRELWQAIDDASEMLKTPP